MNTVKSEWRFNMQASNYDQAAEEELRFLHRRMRLNQMRERNKRRSTAWMLFGLMLTTAVAIWMAVRA